MRARLQKRVLMIRLPGDAAATRLLPGELLIEEDGPHSRAGQLFGRHGARRPTTEDGNAADHGFPGVAGTGGCPAGSPPPVDGAGAVCGSAVVAGAAPGFRFTTHFTPSASRE